MTHAQRQAIRHNATAAAVGVAAAQIFVFMQDRRSIWDHVAGVFVGLFITLAMMVLERTLFPRLQRQPFFASLCGHLFGYALAILFGFFCGIALARMLERGMGPFDARLLSEMRETLVDPAIVRAYGWAFGIILLIAFVGELSRKLGPGVLRNWMLGRYYSPRQEERVFMFLDLKGSTAIAERLGDLCFSELVRDFFADITPAIIETRGEVSHFIGDEVVITWPLRAGLEDSNCVQCFFRAKCELAKRQAHYRERFGVIPQFKAGLHAGSVVATEVGSVKSEIVFHGDVVNTASRIQAECNAAGAELLVSEKLLGSLQLPSQLYAERAGDFLLKGKEQTLVLFSVMEGLREAQGATAATVSLNEPAGRLPRSTPKM